MSAPMVTGMLRDIHVRRWPDGTARIGVEGECVDGAGIFWSAALAPEDAARVAALLTGPRNASEPEPDAWACEACGAEFDTPTTSHARSEHERSCDGSCRGCPVPVECGPVTKRTRYAQRAVDDARAWRAS